ncbi:FecR domain-containing protein [Alistipes sp. OttesenSCG-928-B03]|nr:FecR domain-containing protein [Alistipes sp. OttesenSCG-928-B03]
MNRNVQDKTDELDEDRLEKAFEVLDYMNNVDVGSVRAKTQRLIAARRSKRRRMAFARYGAAGVMLLLLCAGIWLFVGRRGTTPDIIARISEDVMLTMPDGTEVIFAQGVADNLIADEDGVSVKLTDGSLVYEKEPDASLAELRYNNLHVPRGTKFDIVLEDGTHVWLNSDSRMRFPSVFTQDERRVFLEGEAYFAVSPNAAKPFVVETGEQVLKVLGTEFNVHSYPNDEYIYTTLVEGCIAVKAGGDGAELVLTPGQQAQWATGGASYAVRNVDAGEVATWRDGMFVFDGISLEQAFTKLSRWYDFDYTFDDSRTRNLVLRGSVPIYDDLNSVLKIIEASGLAAIEQNGRQVMIKMKK